MARRIGLLSVSMAAMALAIGGFFIQGAGAGSAPVEVADFGAPAASVADAMGGGEYDPLPGGTALFHSAAAHSKPACVEGSGLGVVTITDDVAILCKDGEVLGYLTGMESGGAKLVDQIQPQNECPSEKDEDHPDA
jgi:hypothetical protein